MKSPPVRDLYPPISIVLSAIRMESNWYTDALGLIGISDRPIDNLSIDKDGSVWGAAFVHAMELVNVHFANPSINTASSALRITPNDGAGSYFGEKYKIERVRCLFIISVTISWYDILRERKRALILCLNCPCCLYLRYSKMTALWLPVRPRLHTM